jgi:hypothetical protein
MDFELDPAQPPEVVRALRELLASRVGEPDPWWQAGLDESLGSLSEDP